MAKTPAIADPLNPEIVQRRMNAVKIPEHQELDLEFDNDEPLEKKEEKIALAAKYKNMSEYYMMRAIGQIYLEGQWFTKWIIKDGERVSVPGDYNDETEYITHLTKLTGYTRRYIMQLILLYRIYLKHKKYLDSIHYEKVGHIGKIAHLDKAMDMVDSGELERADLKKILLTGTISDISDVVSRKAIPAIDDYELESTAQVRARGDTVYIDDEPVFKIVSQETEGIKKSLLAFLSAEKKKSEMDENKKAVVETYSNRVTTYISKDKIPIVIPVDSDISDIKSFERAASRELDRFYKKWKEQN
jgi:hypothetical protein